MLLDKNRKTLDSSILRVWLENKDLWSHHWRLTILSHFWSSHYVDQLTEATHFPKSWVWANIWPRNLLNRCSGVWKWSKILFSSHLSFSFNWFHFLLTLITFFDNQQHLSQPKIIDCIFQSIMWPATIMKISRKKWWGTIKQNTSCP